MYNLNKDKLTSLIKRRVIVEELSIISKKYEVLETLGHGANGTVYLVRHKGLNTLRAVKVFDKNFSEQNFLTEINLLKNLRHPSIPIVYDVEEDERYIYVIEEYIDGNNLSVIIQEKGKLPEKEACSIALQLCNVLIYLHNLDMAIVHLDLKPENVIFCENGTVKLIDFDNSAFMNDKKKACSGSVGFAAPEQYHRLEPNVSSDIYAWGMLFLFMLTGEHDHSKFEQIKSKEICLIIRKCIRHNPRERYANIDSVKDDLNTFMKKINKEVNLSLGIHFIGIKRGVGNTHIALSLTKYLTDKNISCCYMDKTKRNDIRALTKAARLGDNGAFTLFGINILPDYCGYVKIQDVWDIHIYDHGTFEEDLFKEYEFKKEVNIYVFVGFAKPYEYEFFENQVTNILNKCKEKITEGFAMGVLNHMSGQQFYSYLKVKMLNLHTYRMPCQFEWNVTDENVSAIFDEMFGKYLPEYHRKYEVMSLWRKSFEIMQRIFRKNSRRR